MARSSKSEPAAVNLADMSDDEIDAALEEAIARDDWEATFAVCREIERRETRRG